ncbi:MAG: SAM-dependent chlorinase/fluorinase [Gammaproteobacteria bacterium]|nr:SAM-dependent chlorinase/fluorinase [Gammaproteobacteria bacterium]MDH5801430.1 SAM-dependent chlorinase/fluorinase [Gammaproteobacteria bacterium]
MIVLFTDFGVSGPYMGQMKAVLLQQAPTVPIVDLFADAPAFDPRCSAYLLAAYVEEFPVGTVFLCVVDPGVGSARHPMMANIDGRWFVGPDNGLFQVVAQRAKQAASMRLWHILWRPQQLSNSFHGRDLFAPVAAQLAANMLPSAQELAPTDWIDSSWTPELPRIIYIDHYGNAMAGVRADSVSADTTVHMGAQQLQRASTFADVPTGTGFWYKNANGLLEISINQGSAAQEYNLAIGDEVSFGQP